MKCQLHNTEVSYPCSPNCALFGDCVTAFQKPRTTSNADLIRSFDDDQLAKLLYRMAHKSQKPYNQNQVLEWLKKPAEGSELNG